MNAHTVTYIFSSVPATREPCGPRINITFRWIMNHEVPSTGCGQKHMVRRRIPYIPFTLEVWQRLLSNSGEKNDNLYILKCSMSQNLYVYVINSISNVFRRNCVDQKALDQGHDIGTTHFLNSNIATSKSRHPKRPSCITYR